MARSLEIPTIVGTKSITDSVKEGDMLAVNGIEGEVIVHPTDEQIETVKKRAKNFFALKAEWDKLKDALRQSQQTVNILN